MSEQQRKLTLAGFLNRGEAAGLSTEKRVTSGQV
jgi:hypothetical protein